MGRHRQFSIERLRNMATAVEACVISPVAAGKLLREAANEIARLRSAPRETDKCTLCSSKPAEGCYTGCLVKDLGPLDGWNCDGKGNLTRI